MLDTNYCVVLPNWQQPKVHRLGRQYRRNGDRFEYVKNLGWFVYVRAELFELSGLISLSGVLGPFADISLARSMLGKHLQSEPAGRRSLG